METKIQKVEKFGQSLTLKGILIGIMSILLLIPGAMIQELILERQMRSKETIQKINEKWSLAQTLNGPFLVIPYQIKTVDNKNNMSIEKSTLSITPEKLDIKVVLTPEERHFGIYKSILYKSDISFSGHFNQPAAHFPANAEVDWAGAYFRIGISDLRGITKDIEFKAGSMTGIADASGQTDAIGAGLRIAIDHPESLFTNGKASFSGNMKLKGSESINFVPAGKSTQVEVNGNWASPGFSGSFSPEYSITDNKFTAKWNVLHFNRNIPEAWTDSNVKTFEDSSFGVNLVDTVDHYQQNMRSAKYAFMFIALTFVVFFFVEVITRKKIHPVQYLLVGIALILFYSLLLSISEQTGFGWAYAIASVSTIALIAGYANSIFKNKKQTALLAGILAGLYLFLYIVLQLEDIALLIGSIGLFVILGIIMYVSGKIKWYKQEDIAEKE